MTFFRKLLATNAPAAVILVRLIVGGVFLSEGIQKFLFPEALGVGRFAKIGIPAPEAAGLHTTLIRHFFLTFSSKKSVIDLRAAKTFSAGHGSAPRCPTP